MDIMYPTPAEYSAADAVLVGSYAFEVEGTRYAVVEDTNGDLYYYVPGVGFRAVGTSGDQLVDL